MQEKHLENQALPSVDRERIAEIVGPDYVDEVLSAHHNPGVDFMRDKPVDRLVQCLDLNVKIHLNTVIRAVQGLGVRGDHSSIPYLVAKLGHPSYRMRQEAFMAICMIECVDKPRKLLQNILNGTKIDQMAPILSAIAVAALKKIGMEGAGNLVDLESVKQLLSQERVPTSLNDETNEVDAENHAPFQAEDALSILQAHLRLRFSNLLRAKGVAEEDVEFALKALEKNDQKKQSTQTHLWYEGLDPNAVISNLRSLDFTDRDIDPTEMQQLLVHPKLEVRKETLLAIFRMGCVQVADHILELAKTESDPDILALAFAVLETFGREGEMAKIDYPNFEGQVSLRIGEQQCKLMKIGFTGVNELIPTIH